MYCSKCYRQIPDDSTFCPNCGTDVSHPTCINCGKPLLSGDKFCRKCGVAVSKYEAPKAGTEHKSQEPQTFGSNSNYDTPTYTETYAESYTQKPKKKKWPWLIVGVLLLIFGFTLLTDGIFSSVSGGTKLSESEYKALCKTVSYDALARNPDANKGNYYTLYGEVIQVVEDGNDVQLRVNVTPVMFLDEVSYYEDTVYVFAELPKGGKRILEGDMIRIYGECVGLITYRSLFDQQISLPGIYAAYWSVG